MTLEEIFTAHALAGLCANPELHNTPAKNLAFLAADIGWLTAKHFKQSKQPNQSPAQGSAKPANQVIDENVGDYEGSGNYDGV